MKDKATEPVRAIVEHHKWGVSVKCPIGHALTHKVFDDTWAGSAFAAEVSAHQAGHRTSFDRSAERCCAEH